MYHRLFPLKNKSRFNKQIEPIVWRWFYPWRFRKRLWTRSPIRGSILQHERSMVIFLDCCKKPWWTKRPKGKVQKTCEKWACNWSVLAESSRQPWQGPLPEDSHFGEEEKEAVTPLIENQLSKLAEGKLEGVFHTSYRTIQSSIWSDL